MLTADQIIETLGLEPLPHEGGAFRETYRSSQRVDGENSPDGGSPATTRAASTQIYYLLRTGESSALHRVRSDEVFHHYFGDPVVQLRIDDGSETFGTPGPVRSTEVVTIGSDLLAGERPQILAPRHVWQGAVLEGGAAGIGYALLGCTVAPGFEWADFELIKPDMAQRFAAAAPRHADLIRAMTPVPGRTRA